MHGSSMITSIFGGSLARAGTARAAATMTRALGSLIVVWGVRRYVCVNVDVESEQNLYIF